MPGIGAANHMLSNLKKAIKKAAQKGRINSEWIAMHTLRESALLLF
jgi:hypothetical protein